MRELRSDDSPPSSPRSVVHVLPGSVALAGLTYLAGWFWTGQGSGKNDNPAQVIGCAVSLVVIAVLASLYLHPLLGALIGTVAFTAAWSVHANANDRTGLWPIGAVMLFVGVMVGWSLVALLTDWGRERVSTRQRNTGGLRR